MPPSFEAIYPQAREESSWYLTISPGCSRQGNQNLRAQRCGHRAQDDRRVVLRESPHLLRSGWSLSGENQCLVNGEVYVPLSFQNQSLVIHGQIRSVALWQAL